MPSKCRTVLLVKFHPSTTSQDFPFKPMFLIHHSRIMNFNKKYIADLNPKITNRQTQDVWLKTSLFTLRQYSNNAYGEPNSMSDFYS